MARWSRWLLHTCWLTSYCGGRRRCHRPAKPLAQGRRCWRTAEPLRDAPRAACRFGKGHAPGPRASESHRHDHAAPHCLGNNSNTGSDNRRLCGGQGTTRREQVGAHRNGHPVRGRVRPGSCGGIDHLQIERRLFSNPSRRGDGVQPYPIPFHPSAKRHLSSWVLGVLSGGVLPRQNGPENRTPGRWWACGIL